MQQNELVKQCIKNNRTAQRALYEQYAPLMLGVCARYTKSTDDAEDVLQEGFIKVFTHLKQFSGKGELGAWIRRIIVNTALDYIKQHSRYRSKMQFDEGPLYPISTDEADIKINVNQLVELIRNLPTSYQTIFNLVAMEGYPHTEVAEMLGVNENTSRSQYSRARGLLMKWMKQEEIRLQQAQN